MEQKNKDVKAEQKKKWYQKPSVRIIALILALSFITEELVMSYLSARAQAQLQEAKEILGKSESVQQYVSNPVELMRILDEINEQNEEQRKLDKACDELVINLADEDYEKALVQMDYILAHAVLSQEYGISLHAIRAPLSFNYGRYDDTVGSCSYLITAGQETEGYYHYIRGVSYLQLQNYEAAEEDLCKAIEQGYEDKAMCYLQLALCVSCLEEYDEVFRYAELAKQENLEDEDALASLDYALGIACVNKAQFEEGLNYFTNLTERREYGQDAELYYYRGMCYLALEQYEPAYNDFEQATEIGADSAVLSYNKGIAALGMGNLQEAKAELKKVIGSKEEPELAKIAKELWNMLEAE